MLKLPPPIWMFLFMAAAGGASALYPWRRLIDLQATVPGAVLALAGAALGASAFMLFLRERTEIQPTSPQNAKLVVAGPYRLTRNPMYLCLVLLSLGMALMIGAAPMFLVPLAVLLTANFVHIPFEEAKMRRQFGAAYDEYCARVRRWI